MGFRFRKSVKIAPGVRMNLGKKSASVSVGGKGFRKTYSTSGRKTTSASIPGTGLSYSKSTSTSKSSSHQKRATAKSGSVAYSYSCDPVQPQYSEATYRICGITCLVISIPVVLLGLLVSTVEPAGFIFAIIGLCLLFVGLRYKKLAVKIKEEEPIRLARMAELLEWQNTVCEDKSEKLFMSTKQLEEATIQAVSNDIRIFDDCSNILNKTSNPTVFFPRLDLAEKTLMHLCTLEPFIEKTNQIAMNETASDLHKQFLDNKDKYVCDFIYRYFWTVKEKAETLKTEKGKLNQYQKFFDSLQPYSEQISEQNMKYVEAMYQQKI